MLTIFFATALVIHVIAFCNRTDTLDTALSTVGGACALLGLIGAALS